MAVEPTHAGRDGTLPREREPRSVEATPVMPGTPEQAATNVERVSPEGRPGVAVAGPGTLWLTLAAIWLGLAVVALILSVMLSWAVGLAVLAIGSLALMLNPVLGAVTQRAEDRSQAIREGDAPSQTR